MSEIIRRKEERAGQARLEREQAERAAAERAAAAQAALTVVDPGPLSYCDLAVCGDRDLERQIDARWGISPDMLKFRLVELDPQLLAEHAPPDGLQYYLDLAAEEELEHDEDFDDEESGLYHDGRRRYAIASAYSAAFKAGEPVVPIVIDLSGEVILLDGFHRLAGALDANAPTIRAYELLPEDE